MRPLRRWDPGSRWAALFVALAVGGAVYAVLGAWRLQPAPLVATAMPEIDLPHPPPSPAATTDSLVSRLLARHPFREERVPAGQRYRFPSDRPVQRTQQPQRVVRATGARAQYDLALVGTAAYGSGRGTAALRMPGGRQVVLQVGDTVQGLRLVDVGQGSATLQGPDTTLVLRVRLPERNRERP